MGLFSRGESSHPAASLDEAISQSGAEVPGELFHITPDKDNGGMETAARVWRRVHSPETTRIRGKNVSDPIAFELWYDGTTVDIYAQTSSARAEPLENRLTSAYTESRIKTLTGSKEGFPSIGPNDVVAGATLDTEQHYFYPLRSGADLESDPYADVIEEMTTGESRVVVQIVARDELDSWTRGTDGVLREGKRGIADEVEDLRRDRVVGWRNPHPEDPPEEDLTKADIIEEELGKRGFSTAIRVLVISPDESEAQRRCKELSKLLEGSFEDRKTEQALTASPVPERRLRAFVDDCLARTWEETGTVLTDSELSALAHLLEGDDISNPAMSWALGELGEGIPPSHPRFDFSSVDLSEEATREEKQLAMIDASGPGDPYYVGWGLKHGTEAGIYEEFLNAHMQATGRTRMGKTTLATNMASQNMRRGHGALVVVLGKDDDDEEFIAEWPEDRPREDFVFIDTGSEFENKVRFNLLEVPEELELGTTEHRSYIENLCDDFCAAFAQAGGDDSLYPLMRGVTRTLVRGMAMSDRTCTPLDLAQAASRHANMGEFAAWMEDEGIHFIDETARRFAEEKEEGDFEPIARRMEELRHNGNLREWLAAREPTVRIQDLVNDGKVCVLRIAESLGDTEREFAINPIVRRFGHAKKMAHQSGANTDPYYIIWDEADKAITKHSSVGQMLSEYGGYGVRFCLLYQSPSYQLPAYLKDATEAQIDTTVSFRTEGSDARWIADQHTDDIDASSLNLPRHSCLINTDPKGNDSTPSFRVKAFPPIREVRTRVGGQEPMTDDEIYAMKRESVERYGAVPPSTEEMKAQSHFSSGTIDGENGVPDELDMSTEYCRNQALAAVFDASIREDGTPGFVSVENCLDRLQQYLPGGEALTDADKAYRSVIQKIPDGYIGKSQTDAEREVKALDTGFMNIGETENDGGAGHGELLADAYPPFTQLGFRYTVPDQTGEAMPDALASVEDALVLDGVTDPDQIAKRVATYRREHPLLNRLAGAKDAYIEAEKSTGDSQPSQTVQNLAQAHNAGHRCLFTARSDVAERVYNTVGRAPMGCRSAHSVEGERRFYTGTTTLSIEDQTMTRPGSSENVWVHDQQTGQYVLRDDSGTEHARFDTAIEIFTDAGAYPDEGDRNIKPPVIPEYECDGDLDAVEWDIIVVPEAPRDDDGQKELLSPEELTLYRDEDPNVPLTDLLKTDTMNQTATSNNGETAASEDDASQSNDDLEADVLGMGK